MIGTSIPVIRPRKTANKDSVSSTWTLPNSWEIIQTTGSTSTGNLRGPLGEMPVLWGTALSEKDFAFSASPHCVPISPTRPAPAAICPLLRAGSLVAPEPTKRCSLTNLAVEFARPVSSWISELRHPAPHPRNACRPSKSDA
jgi:hypothetical protein